MAKSKAQILAMTKRRYTEFGGVRLQSLSELELSALESRWASKFRELGGKLHPAMRAELLATVIVDDEGNRVFSDSEVDQLSALDGGLAKSLYLKAREHCGMDDDEDMEKLEKKFDEIVDSDLPPESV